MKTQTLFLALVALCGLCQKSFAQGGPMFVDHLIPAAWENPMSDFLPGWLDSYFPTTVIQGQTKWVATRKLLERKHADYYIYMDHNKQTGSAKGFWDSSHSHKAYLEWEISPGDIQSYPDPAQIYYAIDLSQYDAGCFQQVSGPYAHLTDAPIFVGQIGGMWIAFAGYGRAMGKKFTTTQINKVKEVNKGRNGNVNKSDFRPQLVNEFLALHPEIDPSEIPVDTAAGITNPSVCHILPAIAPEGNGCGRNAYRNAILVSADLNDVLLELGLPTDAFVQYCNFLNNKYNKKAPAPLPPGGVSFRTIRDPRDLGNADIEFIDEHDALSLMEYIQVRDRGRTNSPTPAPALPK